MIMKLSQPTVTIYPSDDVISELKKLEKIGRTCYKSEDKITDDSYKDFLSGLVKRKHLAMLEHVSCSVLFHTDRGVTHEMVRHRIASFAQSSTRYCNYSKDKFGNEIDVIEPMYFDIDEPRQEITLDIDPRLGKVTFMGNSFDVWFLSCLISNWAYITLTNQFNRPPEQARSVLPQSTAADIWITANLREWRTIFELRALGKTGKPHPDMQFLMKKALDEMAELYSPVFDDLIWEGGYIRTCMLK